MKKLFIVSVASVLIYSCSGNKTEDTGSASADSSSTQANADLQKQILGEWNASLLKVTINSALNNDSLTEQIDVNEENWERVLKSKPLKTIFNEDGTYAVETRTMKDSVIKVSSGKWYTVNDSVFMNQKQPDVKSFQYKVLISNNKVDFTGIVDWEGDTKTDDNYFCTMKK